MKPNIKIGSSAIFEKYSVQTNRFVSNLVWLWGTVGVIGLLAFSVYRLSPIAVSFFDYPLTWWHWLCWCVWILFMAYSEGYKGFQLAFSPRVAARLLWLAKNPQPRLVLLAPLYAMGFIYATRRRKIVSYSILAMVLVFIAVAELLPGPWRALIDGGVVVGLSWGSLSTLWYILRVYQHEIELAEPELPDQG